MFETLALQIDFELEFRADQEDEVDLEDGSDTKKVLFVETFSRPNLHDQKQLEVEEVVVEVLSIDVFAQ